MQAIDVEARSATVTFDCDESARGIVYYGLSCGSLTETAAGTGYAMSPTVSLTGLDDDTTYFYVVEAEDEAGNVSYDDNGGVCYTFSTPQIPDYFTELFASGTNDLDDISLIFTPNGSNDFYAACAEAITALPTDPTGGTTLSLSDDGNTSISLTGTVYLYGVGYTSPYVGANGYITFTAGDGAYNETLADHFDLPRISALFDDLDPAQGGTLSWKELADRVAVTWDAVPEHNGSTENTFQIEMYFDGRIVISYLTIEATDGLAGLSEGAGLSADYYATDLSELGPCGPQPPTAEDVAVSTPESTPVGVTLVASDDGEPNPPGALEYVITSLPVHGSLSDPNAGAIGAVPYTLASYGDVVTYTPEQYYNGADAFQYVANDGGTPPNGGDSDVANVFVTVGGPQAVYVFPLDSDPGWSVEGEWAFGQPTGQGGAAHGYPDPSAGATGTNVYGMALSGDYSTAVGGPYYLTAGPLDLTGVTGSSLKFQRWLNIDNQPYTVSTLEVSNDGSNWVQLWANGTSATTENAWSSYEYDISATADEQETVYIRWGYRVVSAFAYAYSGWNIDDVEIWGLAQGGPLLGDLNCDGVVNNFDIDAFVLAITDEVAYGVAYPECDIMLADVDEDGTVSNFDIDPFVALLGS